MTAMQRLLWPATTQAYLQHGLALMAGPAVRMDDAAVWTTPAQVLGAYGIAAEGVPSVDVLRFATTPTMELAVPSDDSPTTRAGHLHGFLAGRDAFVAVWDVAPTTLPIGAEIWRIHADARQELVDAYEGPALGWRTSRALAQPTATVGPRAVWQGVEHVAAWVDAERVELVALVAPGQRIPDGFEQTRPSVARRVVAARDCERIVERTIRATWRGDVPCRIVQPAANGTTVLLDVDAERAASLGAHELEPGLHLTTVPTGELSGAHGTEREWSPAPATVRAEAPRTAEHEPEPALSPSRGWSEIAPGEVCDILDAWAQTTWPRSRAEVHAMGAERFGWSIDVEGDDEYLVNAVSALTNADVSVIDVRGVVHEVRLDVTDTIREVTRPSVEFLGDRFAMLVREGTRRWGRATMADGGRRSTASWSVGDGARIAVHGSERGVEAVFHTPQGVGLDRRTEEMR